MNIAEKTKENEKGLRFGNSKFKTDLTHTTSKGNRKINKAMVGKSPSRSLTTKNNFPFMFSIFHFEIILGTILNRLCRYREIIVSPLLNFCPTKGLSSRMTYVDVD